MDDSQEHQEDMMDANLMHQSLHMLGQKRLFSDDLDMSFPGQDDERPMPKKKGRKKSFIWSHVMTDEQGKVHCLHCGLLIRVNIGEKVKIIRIFCFVDIFTLRCNIFLQYASGGAFAEAFC